MRLCHPSAAGANLKIVHLCKQVQMAVEANGPGLAEVLTAEPAPAAAGGGAGECGMHSLATVPVPDVAASAPSIFNRVMQTNLQGALPLRCDCLRGL